MTTSPTPPSDGDELIRQIEDWKKEPFRFSCFGLSGTVLLILLAIVVALAIYLRLR